MLELVGMRLDIDGLIKANKPVIVHIPPRHFVVIEHTTDKQVTIVDPASGRRRNIPSDKFSRMWEGNCLVVIEKKRVFSFITGWQIAGPYPKEFDKDKSFPSLVFGKNTKWHRRKKNPLSLGIFINLIEQFGKQKEKKAYAQTWVYSPVNRTFFCGWAVTMVFRFGSMAKAFGTIRRLKDLASLTRILSQPSSIAVGIIFY